MVARSAVRKLHASKRGDGMAVGTLWSTLLGDRLHAATFYRRRPDGGFQCMTGLFVPSIFACGTTEAGDLDRMASRLTWGIMRTSNTAVDDESTAGRRLYETLEAVVDVPRPRAS
jgi:hypothetical protein